MTDKADADRPHHDKPRRISDLTKVFAEETAAARAARRLCIEDTAAAKAARSVEREAANAIKAARAWEHEATPSAKALRNIDLMTRQSTTGWERQLKGMVESPGMKAAMQIERDIERTRRMIDPILENHHRMEAMLAEQTRAERMIADQARQERLLADQMRISDLHADSIMGRTAAMMSESLVGADFPSLHVAKFEDVVSTSTPQLPSREAPRKRPAPARPQPMSITVAAGVSTACTVVLSNEVEPKAGSRILAVWNATTSKTGATVVVAVTVMLAPTSPLTWVAAVGFGWMLLKIRDRAKHLVAHEGLDEPEALRRSWRDFFPKR